MIGGFGKQVFFKFHPAGTGSLFEPDSNRKQC